MSLGGVRSAFGRDGEQVLASVLSGSGWVQAGV